MSPPQRFPAGWDEARVRGLIAHYDAQTEDGQAAEIEAALAGDRVTMAAVPAELADQVRARITRRPSAEPAAPDGPAKPAPPAG